MLGGVQEQNQVHARFALLVVLHELLLHHGEQLRHLRHLRVVPFAVVKVGVHQVAQLPDVHAAVAVEVQVLEHLVELQTAVLAHHLLHEVEEPTPVGVVHQPVVEHAQRLVRPQTHNRAQVLLHVAHHRHALPHLGQVAHVVRVVALGRRRQELQLDGVVNLKRRLHQVGRLTSHVARQTRAAAPPVGDLAVHARERRVVEVTHRDEVEVTQHSRRDGVASAPRGAHRRGELNVLQRTHHELAAVVPAAMVKELAHELDGRLRAVLLELGHVQIVDEHDGAASDGRAENAFAPLVQLGVDDILHGVGVGLRGERALDVPELCLVPRVQRGLDVHRLPRPGGPREQHVLSAVHEQVEQETVANRVDGGDDDVQKIRLFVQRGRVHRRHLEPVLPAAHVFLEVQVVHAPLARRGERLGEFLLGV